MRLILIRHGESENNVLSHKFLDVDEYADKRQEDPNVTDQGMKDTFALARKLSDSGVKIERLYTSAFKRSLISAKILREGYLNEKISTQLPIELCFKLHEKGGC